MKMWNRINIRKKTNYKVHLGIFSEENGKETEYKKFEKNDYTPHLKINK